MLDFRLRRGIRRGHAPAVPAAGPARQGLGPDSRRNPARAIARPGPRARQPRLALGNGDRLRRLRCRRGVGVEGCLRGAGSGAGAVPAQIRRGDAQPRGLAAAMLEMLTRLAGRLASQTRRSEESEHFQQFSTPMALGFVAAEAAALTAADLVLEPSAGTGLLAIFAELARARLALNEIADTRAGLLGRLFRDVAVTRHNAEQIDDRLDPALRPSVVLMNPPFSASPNVEGRFAEAADSPYRLGARPPRRGRTPRRDHRPQCRSGSARLARGLCAPAGKGPRRLHRDDRRPGLCPSRHDDRDPADRHRPRPGRGSAHLSVISRHGRRRRRIARPGHSPGAAAPAGDRGDPPARPRRVSHSRSVSRASKAPPRSWRSSSARRRPRISPNSPTRPANGRRAPPRVYRDPLRRLCAAVDPDSGRAAASDQARAIGRHGRGRPSAPLLPAASAAATALGRHPVGRAARERDLCRRSACRPSRRLLHRRRDLRCRLGCA